MLKGTTKIELTDVNTGETQVIEKHNTVTGALQEMFDTTLFHLTDPSKLVATLPAYTSILGGLLLFDSRIEGDPLPLFAPEDVKLVGCARYNAANLSGSTYLGSYDATESVLSPSTRMAKLVYNFTQTQANGTINSICLTHRNGGFGVYGGDYAIKDPSNSKLGVSLYDTPIVKLVRDSNDRYTGILGLSEEEHLYALDVDNDIGYYFRLTSATKLVMVKRRLRISRYSMFGNGATLIGDPVEISLTTGINVSNSSYSAYNFDPETNALYIVSQPSTSTTLVAGGAFTVTKVELNDTNATQIALTNKYTAPINMQNSYVYRGKVYSLTSRGPGTTNGVAATGFTVVSIPLDGGPANTHGMVVYDATTVPRSVYAADGRLYWQAHYSTAKGNGGLQVTNCVATPGDDNTTLCGADTIDYSLSSNIYYPIVGTPVLNHPLLLFISSGTDLERFVVLGHYLATINNLATPIVKAPTQTMKITYTIQEV